jgi:hypothetical protein
VERAVSNRVAAYVTAVIFPRSYSTLHTREIVGQFVKRKAGRLLLVLTDCVSMRARVSLGQVGAGLLPELTAFGPAGRARFSRNGIRA